jgi:magnesium transporter
LFFSELLSRSVQDSRRKSAGKLADLKVKLGELFPKVNALLIKHKKDKKLLALDWAEVEKLEDNIIRLKPGAEKNYKPLEVNSDELLLKEELLDKQVVDTKGAKIERVNDINLLHVSPDLYIIHVDYGIRGILRRLKWLTTIDRLTNWFFAYSIEEKMISWKYVQPLASDPRRKNLKLNVSLRKLHDLHPSDLADIIEEIDRDTRRNVFRSLSLQTAAETLQEVDEKLQLSLIQSAPEERASDLLEAMEPDKATDLLSGLPEEKKQKLIQTMEKPSRQKVEELLKYDEGTAGSIMTKDFLSVSGDQIIRDAFEKFRQSHHPLETISYLYVTDEEDRLVGVLTLRHLLFCNKEERLSELMNPHVVKVNEEDTIKEVAELFKKYKFMTLPVVDTEGHMIGLITLRDILEATIKEF